MNFACEDIEILGHEISSSKLQSLLVCREKGEIDFKLIDIREIFEYTDFSIAKTDMLIPTSTIHLHMDELERLKDEFIILYCRTGSRTGQMLHILKRMGFEKIAHLSDGIVRFNGETLKNSPLPN